MLCVRVDATKENRQNASALSLFLCLYQPLCLFVHLCLFPSLCACLFAVSVRLLVVVVVLMFLLLYRQTTQSEH